MSYRTPDGRFRKPKEVWQPPSVNEIIKNGEFWKPKIMTFWGEKKYYDQDVRTGECYFCKKEGRAQKSAITNLHHAKYDTSDYLAWTLEVCLSCHYQIDPYNKAKVDSHFRSPDYKKADMERRYWKAYRAMKQGYC